MNYTGPLSKWWMTESCKAAFARHEQAKKEGFGRLKKSQADKKKRLDEEMAQWEKENQ